MYPLSVRLVPDSVVYPTIRVASRPGKLLMGVFDQNGSYVDDTALNRRAGEQGEPVPRDLFPIVTDADPSQAIYAGPLYFHFGHFLLESLARAWYAARHPDLPLAWAGQYNWQETKLRPWQLEILEVLEIRNPTRIIADPTRFEVLHVPDIGYRYDDRFHPEHADFLGRYQGPSQIPGHRLWISRSKLPSDARDLNAQPTERRLTEAGWTIVHPETLGIRNQLDHLAQAEIVAGEEGSAFHTPVLLKDVESKKFHLLRRHGHEHGNLHTIGDVRRMDQSFYTLERQRIVKAEGRWVTKVNPNSSEILDLLDVPVPASPTSIPRKADTIVGQAVASLRPKRLLDVGASQPHLVVGSTAPTRVAVSPRFDFDPRSCTDPDIAFYELGLEQYADLFHADRGPFDVIRIAGSDFSTVMASFDASKRLAHDNSTWIFGSGGVAARAALAVRTTHPGFTVRRLLVRGTTLHVAQRTPGEPCDDAGIGDLSDDDVRRRVRRMRLTSLKRLRKRTTTSREGGA